MAWNEMMAHRDWMREDFERDESKHEVTKKAYRCGYEEGYEDAMKEFSGHMGERSYRINDQYTGKDPGAWPESETSMRGGSSMGSRGEGSMSQRGNMGYREHPQLREQMREQMRQQMSERRRRDSMGRFM